MNIGSIEMWFLVWAVIVVVTMYALYNKNTSEKLSSISIYLLLGSTAIFIIRFLWYLYEVIA